MQLYGQTADEVKKFEIVYSLFNFKIIYPVKHLYFNTGGPCIKYVDF